MTNKFNNVADLVKKLSDEENFSKELISEMKRKTIAPYLFALRCEHKLTQSELAVKMGYGQSTISKIESSDDDDLKRTNGVSSLI